MFLRTYLALETTWKNRWTKLKTTPFIPKPPLTQKCLCLIYAYDLWYIKLKGVKNMNFDQFKSDLALAYYTKKYCYTVLNI